MNISIIVPVYNEEGSIEALAQEIRKTLSGLPQSWEVIFIDDGSTDQTYDILSALAAKNQGFGFMRLSRNLGQSAALACGLTRAQGDIVVSMDGDGQNDPQDIPNLLAALEGRCELVCGWRRQRQDPYLRSLASRCANHLISWITGVRLHDHGCTLRAFKKQILRNVQIMGDTHRLLPAYVALAGFKIKEIETRHRPRLKGKSKYTLANRTLKVLLDAFLLKFYFSYITRPMHFFGYASFGFLSLGFLIELFVVVRRLFLGGTWLSPLFFLGLFFIALSVLFLFLGAMADVLARSYLQRAPNGIYKIEEENLPQQKGAGTLS